MSGSRCSSTSPSSSTESENDESTFLEEHECPICMGTFIDVCETSCSHRFCEHCLSTWFNRNDSWNCPTCRSSISIVEVLHQVESTIERFVAEWFTDAEKKERQEMKMSRRKASAMFPPSSHNPVIIEPVQVDEQQPMLVLHGPVPVHHHHHHHSSNRDWRTRRSSSLRSRHHRHHSRSQVAHRHRHHHHSRSHHSRRRSRDRHSRHRRSSRRHSSRSSNRHHRHRRHRHGTNSGSRSHLTASPPPNYVSPHHRCTLL